MARRRRHVDPRAASPRPSSSSARSSTDARRVRTTVDPSPTSVKIKGKSRQRQDDPDAPLVQGTSVVAVPTLPISSTPSSSKSTSSRSSRASSSAAPTGLGSAPPTKETGRAILYKGVTALTMPGRTLDVAPWGLIAIGAVLMLIILLYLLGLCLGRSYRSDFRKRLALSRQAIMLPTDTPNIPTSTSFGSHMSEKSSLPRSGSRFSIGGDVPHSPFSALHARTRSVVIASQDAIPRTPSRIGFPFSPTRTRFPGLGAGRKSLAIEERGERYDLASAATKAGHHRSMSHPHSHHQSFFEHASTPPPLPSTTIKFASPPSTARALLTSPSTTPMTSPQKHGGSPRPGGFLAARKLRAGSTMLSKVPAKLTALTHPHSSPGKAARVQADLWDGAYTGEVFDDEDKEEEEGQESHVFPPPLPTLNYHGIVGGGLAEEKGKQPSRGILRPAPPPVPAPQPRPDPCPVQHPGITRTCTLPRAPIMGTMSSGGTRDSSFIHSSASSSTLASTPNRRP